MATALTAVVAATENDVIGRDNGMPWHLPADLAHFKALTLGKPVLMGRRTFEAIGRPLPGRRNLVLTRGGWTPPAGVEAVATLDEALQRVADAPELMVIGGATLYAQTLPMTTTVHLTRLHFTTDGDAFFPPLPADQWQELSRERREADARNACAMSFVTLRRVAPAVP
ncbi:MAG: type 3 dihydrofolate reductase [Pseudomonadota bacterium]|jgi:dihydrofolate reductase